METCNEGIVLFNPIIIAADDVGAAHGVKNNAAIKAGKSCANKTGMGLEDWAMEEDEGFGIEIGCVAEVVAVAIGTQAADEGGTGWGVNGVTL